MACAKKFAMNIQDYDDAVPLQTRVNTIAPILNRQIDEFETGNSKEGVQSFQIALRERVRRALCSRKRWIPVRRVGAHPHNREKAGIVPIDMHDLLNRMSADGWNWELVDALAAEMPPDGVMGMDHNGVEVNLRKWFIDFNMELVASAGGLLPLCFPDELDVVTARGTHTTAAVRCYDQDRVAGVHPETMGDDGYVNKAKILGQQPSMNEPLVKGIEYETVCWQLLVACPRLMEILSRTGNMHHSTYRQETTLQACGRIHQIAKSMRAATEDDWKEVIKTATHGKGDAIIEPYKCYVQLVKNWSGGASGHILKSLELCERAAKIKRVIKPQDVQMIGELQLPDAVRYVPAMMKALLKAPSEYVKNGFVEMFNSSDYASLGVRGRNRVHAVSAHSLMEECSRYVRAYSRLDEMTLQNFINDAEIRMVMHVHQKRVATRTDFKSLELICAQLRLDLIKAGDNLPEWRFIGSGPSMPSESLQVMKEIRADGIITDKDLSDEGFEVGTHVVLKVAEGEERVYTIANLTPCLNVFNKLDTSVPLHLDGDAGEAETRIARSELLAKWKVKEIQKVEVACHNVIPKQVQTSH